MKQIKTKTTGNRDPGEEKKKNPKKSGYWQFELCRVLKTVSAEANTTFAIAPQSSSDRVLVCLLAVITDD